MEGTWWLGKVLRYEREFVAFTAALFTFWVSMKCDSCDQKATVFYTQVTDGKMKKTALCETCAEEQGITDPTGLLMADQLMGKSAPTESPFPPTPLAANPEEQTLEGVGKCRTCGFTIADYQKIGRLGCGDCYQAFKSEIEQRLPSLHKGLKHNGHVPAGLVELEKKQTLGMRLKEQLDQAIASENYEDAARYRDKLQEFEKGEEPS